MERQIVFRGKRIKDGKWIFGNLADYSMKVFNTTIEKKVIFGNIVSFATDNFGFVVDDCAVDPNTIGQFTGLLDKNGKEIYEGDIIRTDVAACNFADGACGTVTFLRVVEYDEEKAGFYPFLEEHGMYSHYDWEIIGNMHDRELTYEGKKYKPVLVSDEKGICEKCPLNGKCHLGFSNYVCEIFDGLQLLDDNKVVILQEIHDTPPP